MPVPVFPPPGQVLEPGPAPPKAALGPWTSRCMVFDTRPGRLQYVKPALVVGNLFFRCKPYVTRTQQTLDKNPQNCNDSLSSGSDNKSVRW